MIKARRTQRQFEDRYPEVFRKQDGNLLLSYAVVSFLLSLLHLLFKLTAHSGGGTEPVYLSATVLTLTNTAIAGILAYKGYNKASGLILLAVVIWLILDPALLDGRGLRTPIMLLYVLVILIADFMFGVTIGAIATGAGIAWVLLLFGLQMAGVIPGLQFVTGPPLFNHALFYVVVFSYIHLFNRSFIRRNQQVVEQVEESQRLLVESEKRRMAEQQSRLLMSEMHDGVGGALVTLKMMLGNPQTSQAALQSTLDRCINDLRLTIMAVDPEQPDLGILLASLRADYKRLLENSPVQLQWDVDDAVLQVDVPVASRLHISRVIQEALTNALKHSGGDCIRLTARCTPLHALEITIRDNGSGMPPDLQPASNSYGLRNMQMRAEQGKFAVTAGNCSDGPGFAVHIRWPFVAN